MNQLIHFGTIASVVAAYICLGESTLRRALLALCVFGFVAFASFEGARGIAELVELRNMGVPATWERGLEHYGPPLVAVVGGLGAVRLFRSSVR